MSQNHIKSPRTIEQLKDCVLSGEPSIYTSSKTSMVIPYEKLAGQNLVDLSSLPKKIELREEGNEFYLFIEGPITWKEAREFCQSKGRDIMTSPTEELACMLAGIATSATGERCFGFGTLREQVRSLTYMDANGSLIQLGQKELAYSDLFNEDKDLLDKYKESATCYKGFKNGPFPRLEKEVDLMMGFEGQLGVVVSAEFKTVPQTNRKYIFFKLTPWEQSSLQHMELFEKVQAFRNEVISCELIDSNSISYLPKEKLVVESSFDYVYLEVFDEHFERLYEELLSKVDSLSEESIFEMSFNKCHEFRMNIPRYIFEENARKGVVKKGTDVQVKEQDFTKLFAEYKEMSKLSLPYNLFGHFGDAHLHFNYMPVTDSEVTQAQAALEDLYIRVKAYNASPFAEHGIGFLKKKFIKNFYTGVQYEMFSFLKSKMDRNNIFFPEGFMNISPSENKQGPGND